MRTRLILLAALGGWFGCYAAPVPSSTPEEPEESPPTTPWVPWEVPDEAEELEDEEVDDEELDDDERADDDWRWRGRLSAAADPQRSEHLVVWTSTKILHSDDDGASFHPILDEGSEVWDVALSEGRTWALRGRRLHRRGPDGRERAWPMPSNVPPWSEDEDEAAPRIAASGRRVVLAVPHPESSQLVQLLGRGKGGGWSITLTELAMDSGTIGINDYQELSVDARGRVQITVAWGQGRECGVSYVSTYRGRLGAGRLKLVSEYEDPPELFFAHDGWVYAHCPEDDDWEQLCAHRPGAARVADEPIELPWIRVEPNARIEDVLSVAHDDGRTLVLADRALLVMKGRHAKTLATDVPPDAELLAVDAIGRPVIAQGPRVLRWSVEHGWTELALDIESLHPTAEDP